MELGIVAAISYIGLMSNRVGRQQRYVDGYPDSDYISNPFPHQRSNTDELLQLDNEARRCQYLKSLDPRGTGVIPPNVPPSQWPDAMESNAQTSDFEKQSKLEMFTGEQSMASQNVTSSVVRGKTVQAPMFPPNTNAQAVNSAGKATMLDSLEDQLSRQPVSQYHRNVRPFQQTMVGPGLGLGADVPAARGYQQGYRILPTNLMNYERLNREQAGGANAGAAPVMKYGELGFTAQRKAFKSHDLSQMPMEGSRANYTAPAPRPEYAGRCVNKPSEAYCPNPTGANGQFSRSTAGVPTRHRDDATRTLPVLNPISQHEAGNGYLGAPNNRGIKSNREQPSQLPAAYIGGAAGYVTERHCEPRTNRQDYQQPSVMFASNPHVAAPASRSGYHQTPTNREETRNSAYIGTATGPSAFAPLAGATRISDNKEALLHGYTPGMQSVNAYNPDSVQAVRLKAENNHSRPPVAETSQFLQYTQPGASVACRPRLPEANTFHDPVVQAVQRKQLRDNPMWQPFPV